MKQFLRLLLICFVFNFSPGELFSQTGVYFDGLNDFITFGNSGNLGASQFTLEVWVKREGAGLSVQTDTNGVTAFPLISKGRMEGEGNNLDLNYFLGIDYFTNTLCADFEEGSGQPNPGKNHPIKGITPLCYFQWYHAAVSYDGNTMKLYLNGILENEITFNVLPQSASIQHAALGSALNSTGLASGFFNGRLDEARIWNYARTQAQISSSYTLEIISSPGLMGRWSLNEGTGTSCFNTGVASSADGILSNGPLWVSGTPFYSSAYQGNHGLALEGINSYVSFGNNPLLGLDQFTLETWFMRKGSGSPSTSGSGGVTAIPLIAKGRGESDGNNRDMNYFLGIDTATGFLVADFEEAIGQRNPGRNHPILGATKIEFNTWYHAAVTYDGATWNLYLNGKLENQMFIGQLPQSLSIQHASIGSALNSVGTPEGFFNGIMDEVRIWNIARSHLEIKSAMNSALSSSQTGLIARWGMNEACGISITDSSGNALNANVLNKNWYWTNGASFDQPVPLDQPGFTEPSDLAGNVYLNSNLSVSVSDPEGKDLTVTYFIQPCPNPAPSDFTVVGVPDTQHYVSNLLGGTNEILKSQTNWIRQNRTPENIVFVHGLGDCVENGDNGGDPIEWERFDTAVKIIEDPATTLLTDGIPYGLCVGNHDQTPIGDVTGSTTFFNSYFGESRFLGRDYYGGHYGTKNNNNYSFFSAGGMDFIVINIEYNLNMVDTGVARWLRELLTTYSDHFAIIGSHYILNGDGTFAPQGLALYNVIKRFPNVFFTQSGHVSAESRREDIYDGNKIISIMADYQSRSYGGNGWMRLIKFSPANNTISVKTYSPWLNQFEVDSNSQFSYPFNMNPRSGYTVLGTNSNVPSGSVDSFPISSLLPNTCYYWYVTINNGSTTIKSPVWQFQTVTECTKITSFSPGTGLAGDTIEIKGKNFNVVSGISFNGIQASFTVLNDSVIHVQVPAGASTGKIILKGSCTDTSSTNFIVNNCLILPTPFSVTGGGNYCAIPGTGVLIGLSGSETDISYQLFCNSIPTGSPVSGTGNPLDFGLQTLAGQYTVSGINTSNCSSQMSGQAYVNVLANPMITLSVIDSIVCFSGSATISVQGGGGTAPYMNTGNFAIPAGTYTFSISDMSGCTASSQLTLTEPSKIEGRIFVTNASCGASNGTASVLASGGTPVYSYLWSDGQNSQTALGLAAGNYSVNITDQNGCSNSASTSISNSGAAPGSAGAISGASGVCRNSVVTYSISPIADATSYNWTLPSGSSGSSTSNSITVTFSNSYHGGFLCVNGVNSCGSGSGRCINVPVLTTRPAKPSAISGPANACPINTYSYSVPPAANAMNYVWSVSGTGASIVSGQGTNSISISIASGFSKGKISVYASNCKGNSKVESLDIIGLPIHSNSLVGPSNICAGSTGNSYSIDPVSGASSYLWLIVSGDLQVASQNANNALINAGASFTSGVIAVASFNSCGSYTRTFTIRSIPSQPGGISGLNNGLCLVNNIQYNITPVTGASSYSWTVPSGVQMVSASGTSLNVDFNAGFSGNGNICVTANNSCGQSVARCLPVKSTLSPPSTISGSSSVCKSQTGVIYSIAAVSGASSYLWNISGGAYVTPLGNGTNASADFTWTNSSQIFISVSCENACGYGSNATKTLSVNLACHEKDVQETGEAKYYVFPNPSKGMISLTFVAEKPSYEVIQVEDLLGQVWLLESFSCSEGLNRRELDLSSFPAGVYFLSVETELNEKWISRLVLY